MIRVSTHSSQKSGDFEKSIKSNSFDTEGSFFKSSPHEPPSTPSYKTSNYSSLTTSPLLPGPEHRSVGVSSTLTRHGTAIKSSLTPLDRVYTSIKDWERISSHQQPPNVPSEHYDPVQGDPPRPARDGWEWVWFPEGYWAERERPGGIQSQKRKRSLTRWRKLSPGQKTDSSAQCKSKEITESWPAQSSIPSKNLIVPRPDDGSVDDKEKLSRITRSSSGISSNSSKLLRGFHYISPTYPHFRSPSGEPEGLYCKAKRSIEEGLIGKRDKVAFSPNLQSLHDLPSRTTATLEGATNALEHIHTERRRHHQTHFAADGRTSSMDSLGPLKRPGLAPWHRRNSQDTLWSVTSSVREVLRGKTPMVTPNPQMEYGGHKGKKYAKVDITNSDDPTFLPSEARLVHSPPASADTTTSRARGFFLELKPSTSSMESESSINSHVEVDPETTRDALKANPRSPSKREWWDVEDNITKAAVDIQYPTFDFDPPEHLPSSPLCPMSPKHKSGGTGVCVYHGRRAKMRSDSTLTQIEKVQCEV